MGEGAPEWLIYILARFDGTNFRSLLRESGALGFEWRRELHLRPWILQWFRAQVRRKVRKSAQKDWHNPKTAMDFKRTGQPLFVSGVLVGVYFLFNDGRLAYVGQSTNWASRISGHRSWLRYSQAVLAPVPADVLLPLEAALIKHFLPPKNKVIPEVSPVEGAALIAAFRREFPDLWRRLEDATSERCA